MKTKTKKVIGLIHSREANQPLREQVEPSLITFVKRLKNLKLEFNIVIDNSYKTTIPIL